MSNSIIKQNLLPEHPDLADLIAIAKTDTLLSIFCHHIGTIQSFDADNQTATATINYTRTYFNRQATGLYTPVQKDYPILVDCPVVFLGGGDTALTMPVAIGDECLVLFNDRDIKNWFAGNPKGPVSTPRLHSSADGLIIVGIRSLPNVLEGFDTIRALLSNGTVKLGINPSNNKVLISNGTTLNSLLQDLCTQLQSLTSTLSSLTVTAVSGGLGTSGPPSNAAAITSIGTQISSIASNIGNLLE